MDPEILLAFATENAPDILAIEKALGGAQGMINLMPHIVALIKTYQKYAKK